MLICLFLCKMRETRRDSRESMCTFCIELSICHHPRPDPPRNEVFLPCFGVLAEICPFLWVFLPAGMKLLAAADSQPCHCSAQEWFVPTKELIKRIWGINFYSVGILYRSLFPAYLQKSVAGCTLQGSGVNNKNLFHMRGSFLVIKQDDV